MFRSVIFCLWIFVFILSSVGQSSRLHAEVSRLEPAKTHAVIVGVLEWQNTGVTTYSAKGRKDRELHAALGELGVPKENMVLLLDEAATLERMQSEIAKVARRAKADDTFIFYYAGHGSLGANFVSLLNYDAGTADTFAVTEISRILKKEFHGKRVLLFADCCFSGGLEQAAKELADDGFQAASLTSADASVPSTNNWTFTQMLVDVLRGSPAADRDGDREITLSEAAAEVADAMKFHEAQQYGKSSFAVPTDFMLCKPLAEERAPNSTVNSNSTFRQYEYVRAQEKDRGSWLPGRILHIGDDSFQVEIQEYATRRKVQLTTEQIRKFGEVTYKQRVLPRPETVLDDQAGQEKASVSGKYSRLLKKVYVESDYRTYGEFNDYGYYQATNYAGQSNLPAAYWVYVYPNWYLWKSKK